MPEFHKYSARHGESAMQALIERLERYEGIRANTNVSLEERWAVVMQADTHYQRAAA